MLGVFYSEAAGKEKSLKALETLMAAMPPHFQVAMAYYPGDKPPTADREKHAILHTHGIAILGPTGTVRFIQTLGVPEGDFKKAFQDVLNELGAAGGARVGESAPKAPADTQER
jgi:hypothetical protein